MTYNVNNVAYEPVRSKELPPLPKVKQIAMLVDDENYSQVDLYAQHILRVLPQDAHANLACAWVAAHLGFDEQLHRCFETAKQSGETMVPNRPVELIAQDLRIDLPALLTSLKERPNKEGNQAAKLIKESNKPYFHLAKAWGFGFGSEMSAVMGQAYMAEAMGRELIVHWGSNFLYRPSEGSDCVFNYYFEPFNALTMNDAFAVVENTFPPKWQKKTLALENLGKRNGEYSKLSALYFLNREERLTVSDYYAGVVNIRPWLSDDSPLKKLSLDDAYRYLAKKYLQPKQNIVVEVDEFVKQNLSCEFVAVHARGSDKDEGYRALTSIPGKTLECAKQRLSSMSEGAKLFLMTDDIALLEVYQNEFGDRLVQTDCQRCDTQVGVHYDDSTDKHRAGREMLIDMLVAARANCFIGLGLSNPSQLIRYFGDFTDDNYILFGENRLKQLNTHLYKTISVRS